MAIVRAISITVNYPADDVYESLRIMNNLLKIFPIKVEHKGYSKSGAHLLKFKFLDFNDVAEVNFISKKENGMGIIMLDGKGEVSIGIGVIRYKKEFSFYIKFEIISLAVRDKTDIRIELMWNSPDEDTSFDRKIVAFLNETAQRIYSELPSMVKALPTRPVIQPTAPKEEVPIKAEQKLQVPPLTKGEAKPTTIQDKKILNNSKLLSDPLVIQKFLNNAKLAEASVGDIDENFVKHLTEMSKGKNTLFVVNGKIPKGRFRLLFENGEFSGAFVEIENKILFGEEALRLLIENKLSGMYSIYEGSKDLFSSS